MQDLSYFEFVGALTLLDQDSSVTAIAAVALPVDHLPFEAITSHVQHQPILHQLTGTVVGTAAAVAGYCKKQRTVALSVEHSANSVD